jgi:hypothetical protein
MAYFAVLNGDTVINIILCDNLEIAQEVTRHPCVEYTNEKPAGVGWTYDGTNFIAPVVETIEEN